MVLPAQAIALLKDAEVCATDGEWDRATCAIRRRRGTCHVSHALDLVAAEVQGPARPIDGGVSQQRGDKANEERGECVLCRCPLWHCTLRLISGSLGPKLFEGAGADQGDGPA